MKIGFACKFHSDDQEVARLYNFKTTTATYLSKLERSEISNKLGALCHGNLESLTRLVGFVGALPESRRMLRISGDVFPLYSHPVASFYYNESGVDTTLRESLSSIGAVIRGLGIRISFHPGQYTVLGSSSDRVVADSIGELEYHTGLMLALGFRGWHDSGCAINIHAGSKKVPLTRLRENIGLLSEDCRNFLTIENDEFSYGLRQITEELGDLVAIVPDLHHEWVYRGSYVASDAPEIDAAIASWRGLRPKLHCSMSKEDLGIGDAIILPPLDVLLSQGLNRSKLRQHSDGMWHPGLCEYYRQFSDRFDIMVEAKHKQLAAEQLHSFFNSTQEQQ